MSDSMIPLYDISKSYLENAEEGPLFSGPYPERVLPPRERWIDVLGLKAATPIGIPAGPLLNSKWIECASKLGFDLLTYKTIRAYPAPAHPLPNIVFVEAEKMLCKGDEGRVIRPLKSPPQKMESLAITNSFGNPSRDREYLARDLCQAKESLLPGQLLIVSVFGSGLRLQEELIEAASLAKASGADLIEANFSCPNVGRGGILYLNPDLAYSLTKALVRAIHPLPLIVKVGLFPDESSMERVFLALARGGAAAVCGINTVSMRVEAASGKPVLGEERPRAGICGAPIRELALDFIRTAVRVNRRNRLQLLLLGCGGAVEASHFDQFLEAGADIAMSASGMMWNPYLAYQWRLLHEKKPLLPAL